MSDEKNWLLWKETSRIAENTKSPIRAWPLWRLSVVRLSASNATTAL